MPQPQNRPASPRHAPDPANNYERAQPENESGMGSLHHQGQDATPTNQPDNLSDVVSNAHPGDRQLNAHDDPGGTGGGGQPLNQINLSKPAAPDRPDHSMFDEEAQGWDTAPTDISNPRDKRHPRTGGKGGAPDADDPDSRG